MPTDWTGNGPETATRRHRRLGRHMHATLTAVWRYLRAEYDALDEAEKRLNPAQSVDAAPAERISEKDKGQGPASGRWRADRDLKLEYMFRVMKHQGSSHRRWILIATELLTFTREELQEIPAKTAYYLWSRRAAAG